MTGATGRHNVDRDLPEMLQELRVVQTGGQLFFAFLFTVAFAPGFEELDAQQRTLYGWTMFVVTSAIIVLVAPVAVHRVNFGKRKRPQLLVVAHWLALCGLILLGVGTVLGMLLISSVVFPDSPPWLAIGAGVLIAISWIGIPILTRTARFAESVVEPDNPGPHR